jgi:1-acyl-sn-glycerol-3-phosphate acyltransferase
MQARRFILRIINRFGKMDIRQVPPKPITDIWRPELVRLPKLTWSRRAFRLFIRLISKLLTWLLLRVEVQGIENFPRSGPAIVVTNHLGDTDSVVLLSSLPYVDAVALGKIELYDVPIIGKILDLYGIIWLHRGQPDKRAIRAALDGLAKGRIIVIAPEGRYSLTGSLEEGTDGAAFLAYKANVPIVAMALTGTENANVYGHLRGLRRPRVTLKVGERFKLSGQAKGHEKIREGTRQIMEAIASLLPVEYRGPYSSSIPPKPSDL